MPGKLARCRDCSRFPDSLKVLPSLGFAFALGIYKPPDLGHRHIIGCISLTHRQYDSIDLTR